MLEMLKKIPPVWQAALGIAGIVSLAFGAGAAFTGFTNLPERVDRIEVDMLATERDHNARFDLMERAIDELTRNVELANCLAIAERSGDDWRACLNEP